LSEHRPVSAAAGVSTRQFPVYAHDYEDDYEDQDNDEDEYYYNNVKVNMTLQSLVEVAKDVSDRMVVQKVTV
jgi:hypothetical protein